MLRFSINQNSSTMKTKTLVLLLFLAIICINNASAQNGVLKTYGFQEIHPTVLAAYNAGHGKVSQWLDDLQYSEDGYHLEDIPYPETNSYVRKVEFVQKLYEICYGM